MDEFWENNGLIVDFWNDEAMFVTHIKWKCALKKYVIVISKLKWIKNHHKMNNLIVRCIENFSI
jgi:hypothetical protein